MKKEEFETELRRVLAPSVYPVGKIEDEGGKPMVKEGAAGSGLLLEWDHQLLFVTNAHVADILPRPEPYVRWAQIVELPIDPKRRLCVYDRESDLAVFRLCDEELGKIALGARPWSASDYGTVKPTKPYPDVMIIGFPGVFRSHNEEGAVSGGVLHCVGVEDVSSNGTLVLKWKDEFFTSMESSERNSYLDSPGGISGAPVFVWNEGKGFLWVATVFELVFGVALRAGPAKRVLDLLAREIE